MLSAAVIVLFLYYFNQNREEFKPLIELNPILLIIISLLYSFMVAINGLYTKIIVEPFKVSLTLAEGVFLSIVSSVGNFFAPAGAGYGIRAIYLKKKHGLSYTDYSVTLAGYYVLLIMINSFAGLVALFFLRGNETPNFKLIFIILSLALLVSLLFGVFNMSKIRLPKTNSKFLNKLFNFFIMLSNGWKKISSNRELMIKLIALTLLSLGVTMLLVSLIISALHLSTTFAAVLLYSVLGLLSLFINITPGNIGIKEGVIIFSAGIMGFSVNQVILIAVVERGVVFVSLLYLWAIAEKMKRKFL